MYINQYINVIYLLSYIFLFSRSMLSVLNDSLDFGFRSYRLSLLISCQFKQNFIHDKQLHIYFIARLYLYIQRNVVIISEKYSHYLHMDCCKTCRPARTMYACNHVLWCSCCLNYWTSVKLGRYLKAGIKITVRLLSSSAVTFFSI